MDMTKVCFVSFLFYSTPLNSMKNLSYSPIHRIHKNGGHARARHLRTDRIFVRGFLPSKEEAGISFSQRETEDIVSLLIMLPPCCLVS